MPKPSGRRRAREGRQQHDGRQIFTRRPSSSPRTRRQRSTAAAQAAAEHQPAQHDAAVRVRPQDEQQRNDPVALARQQHQQQRQQNSDNTSGRSTHAACASKRPVVIKSARVASRSDGQPPHQRCRRDHQRCRADLQARHSAHAIEEEHRRLREPLVIGPGRARERVRVVIDARDRAGLPDLLPGAQMPERVVLCGHQRGAQSERHEQHPDGHGAEADAAPKVAKLHANSPCHHISRAPAIGGLGAGPRGRRGRASHLFSQ
jgi:hypothetical protein